MDPARNPQLPFDPLAGGGFVILNGIRIDEDGKVAPLPEPYPGSNLFSLASGGAIFVRDPNKILVDEQLNGGIFARVTSKDWELILPYLQENERLFGIGITQDGALEIGRRSRGTPRIANRLLRRVRDYAQVRGDGKIDQNCADAALNLLDVDRLGLDRMDRQILSTILEKYDGGPVGLDTLAAALCEERDTLEDVYEPFLIQVGFLKRTPRGRMATSRAGPASVATLEPPCYSIVSARSGDMSRGGAVR